MNKEGGKYGGGEYRRGKYGGLQMDAPTGSMRHKTGGTHPTLMHSCACISPQGFTFNMSSDIYCMVGQGKVFQTENGVKAIKYL